MIAHRKRWWAWFALLPALLTTDVTAAETSVRLSLDYEIDGRAAQFLLPFDKGYYKAEGLNVTIDPASGSVETIERVASGNYEMGLADINALIKFRDTKRDAPIKAIFMLYNRPPFAVIGRKSRGVSQPKDLEGKILGAPAADSAYAQWPIFVRVNNIDVSKVKIEIVSFPVREPMLRSEEHTSELQSLRHPLLPYTTLFRSMLYNRPPCAVIGRKSRGVSQPKDLEGKILGAPAADSAYAQWPIFVRVNNIDVSKVKIEIVSFPVREPMLAAGQVDAITGLSYFSFIELKDKGVPVDDIAVLLMADYGVELYGNAIIVNAKFADEHPEAVKGFLVAFMKGLKETVKQPAMAIGSVLKRNADARKNVELERLTMAIRENIITPEVKANGYGEIDEQRFNRALEQMTLAYKFKAAKPKLQDIFDPSFLPPAAVRKYN